MSLFPMDPESQPPAGEPECPGCGSRVRYRGRHGARTVWECQEPSCPVTLFDRIDSGSVQAQRPGARR